MPAPCPHCGRRPHPSGLALKGRRLAAGLSLRELAALLGYSHPYLDRIEKGKQACSARLQSCYDKHLPNKEIR